MIVHDNVTGEIITRSISSAPLGFFFFKHLLLKLKRLLRKMWYVQDVCINSG